MRPLLISILVCFYCSKLCGQNFYVTDANGKFREVTINNGTVTDKAITSCSASAQSIAFQRGTMYYTDGLQLFKADLVNNAVTNCTSFGQFQSFIGLTIDKTGILYLTSSNKMLYTFDPASKDPRLVPKGALPEQPSADMIFYKDQLYVSTIGGIYKVNVANPAQSTLVIPTGPEILGLTVVSVNSTQNKVYALSIDRSITNIIEVDLDNNKMGNIAGILPYYVYDAASNVEDGSYQTLDIDDIKTTADCPYTGRGTVQVVSNYANSNYRFTLGNVTNNTGIFTNTPPGPYNIEITNGPDSKQKQVTIGPFQLQKPQLIVTSRNPKCLDKGNIGISANADADKYSIVFQGNTYPLNRNFELGAGSYHFDIKNLTGCVVDSRDITLTAETCPIILDSLIVKQDCSDPKKGSVTAYTSPGTDKYYFAIAGVGNNTTGTFTGLPATTYTVKITSDGGGSRDAQFTVSNLSAHDPLVIFSKTNTACSVNGTVKFDIVAANKTGYTVSYKSASYPLDHTFQLPDSGRYSFRLMKPTSCVLKDTTISITKQPCQTVFFPNTFTPNNDGINDIFRPVQGTTADQLKFRIFNRLGTMLYTSENARTGWDGSYQGKPVPSGVYYWMASYINNEGINTSQNGSITLIR